MANINNTANDTLLSGTSGDDSIQNGGYWYEDSNYIWHDGGSYVTMDAGDGDDYIRNYQGDKVLIAGGNGNDSISNSGSNVTMDAGAGDDSISLNHDSKYNVILYNEGDGNDTVKGFNADDTLKISGSSYSTIKSGNNIIVTVGTSSIILKGAASLSAVNIDGEEVVNTFLTTLTEGDDEYSNKLDGAIILALGGKDSINSRGRNVLINGGAGKISFTITVANG